MKWHCDKNGYCHKKCESAAVGTSHKGPAMDCASYPIDCTIVTGFRTWADTDTDNVHHIMCPVNKMLLALSDKIVSNIKEHEEYVHDHFIKNKCSRSFENAKDQ
jgi:hypothetical protein